MSYGGFYLVGILAVLLVAMVALRIYTEFMSDAEKLVAEVPRIRMRRTTPPHEPIWSPGNIIALHALLLGLLTFVVTLRQN